MNAETQDEAKFWSDYFEQVELLMDSIRYGKECKALGCDAENVAEHIVFLGNSTLNKVLKSGVSNTLGNDVVLYKERLSPAVADIYRSKEMKSIGQGSRVG